MPRRRMLDPSFTDDTEVAQLTRDERLFLVGCLRNADDEGRLIGNGAFLKAQIFMYDTDLDQGGVLGIRDSALAKMINWHQDNMWLLRRYENGEAEYLCFPNWPAMEKPSHPTASRIPAPAFQDTDTTASSREVPEELPNNSGETPEELQKSSRAPRSQSSLGQSSQVKYSLVKSSAVLEDFTKYSGNENDLTDRLTDCLTEYMPRGPTWMVEVLQELWSQFLGDRMDGKCLAVTLEAVKEHPPPVLAVAYVKAVKYKGGKYNPASYLKKILEEKKGGT